MKHKLLTLLFACLCATGMRGQTADDAAISKIMNEIGGTWQLVPEKDSKSKKKTQFSIEISSVKPTQIKTTYKITGTIVGFAIEDGYAYYQGDVLVFGYTRTDMVGLPPKEEREYITGSIRNGQLTLVAYGPKSSVRVISGNVWERPK